MNTQHMPSTTTMPTETTPDMLSSMENFRGPSLSRDTLNLLRSFMGWGSSTPYNSKMRRDVNDAYIFSGAQTPSRARPFLTTVATASSRRNRAAVTASSPAASTWFTA